MTPISLQVLDDSQDNEPIDSFYYVSQDDPIYDQFDDFGQLLDVPDSVAQRDEVPRPRLKFSSDSGPRRPSSGGGGGPQAEEPATQCDPTRCRLPDCRCGGTDHPGNFTPAR